MEPTPKNIGRTIMSGMYKSNCLPIPINIAGFGFLIAGQKVIAVSTTESIGAMDMNTLKFIICVSLNVDIGNIICNTLSENTIDISHNGSITMSAAKEKILNARMVLSYCFAPKLTPTAGCNALINP